MVRMHSQSGGTRITECQRWRICCVRRSEVRQVEIAVLSGGWVGVLNHSMDCEPSKELTSISGAGTKNER